MNPEKAADGSEQAGPATRGRLRILLGCAPGAGTTSAMLSEAHLSAGRGTDVVVAYAGAHGRPGTAALLAGLEVMPCVKARLRGTMAEEPDIDAVLVRRPEVALLDGFAHRNAPGSCHPARWQDAEELLQAGIDVVSTVEVRQLDSLRDVVERITGGPPGHTVPEAFVRPPTRSRSWTPRRRRCATAWRAATSTRPNRLKQRWLAGSASRTCPRCANWRCCGWPPR